MLLFSFVGLLLSWFDAAKLFVLLFHEPPRRPRNDSRLLPVPHVASSPAVSVYYPRHKTARRRPWVWACDTWATQARTLVVTSAAGRER